MELAARWGGYASHLCAAAELGWEIARQPSLPQVVVPRHREPPAHLAEAEVRRHAVTRADVRGLVTGPQLTVLLCARDLPFDEALTVADSCLRHGGVDHDTLVAAAAAWPEHARRVVATPTTGPPTRSSRCCGPWRSAREPRSSPSSRSAHAGLVLHPDLVDPLSGIVLEADSWGFHASRDDHDRDCVRYNALTATGWRVLRFTYEHVMSSPRYVLATIRKLLVEMAA